MPRWRWRSVDGQAVAIGTPCVAVFGIELPALLAQRECRVRRAGGAEYAAELGLSEWHDMGEVHYTVVLRDLTERRQIERMKDEFLATVSHELRTPLTSVMGALGLMAGGAAGAVAGGGAAAGRGGASQRRASGPAHRRHPRPHQARGRPHGHAPAAATGGTAAA